MSWNFLTLSYWQRTSVVSLLVRLWVEISQPFELCTVRSSASLWGCELKSLLTDRGIGLFSQPPCEAVSWNSEVLTCTRYTPCQPPCEAVSWNIGHYSNSELEKSQPPCEAVSWNRIRTKIQLRVGRQPPCEAVSWNIKISVLVLWEIKSASLWGCELKFHFAFSFFRDEFVSLLVRLWVEISIRSLSI